MEHTEEKWEIDGLYIYHEDSGGRKTFICKMDNVSAPEEEMQANARLIAAAPDLLAACKDSLLELDLLLKLAKPEKDEIFRIAKVTCVEARIKQVDAAIAAAQSK